MTTKIRYKQIVITELPNRTCIFHLAESNFRAEELYVMGIAQFVEYAEYFMPLYVIIDRTGVNYEVPDILIDYVKKVGFSNLRRIGVNKVFQITRYQNGKIIPSIKIPEITNFFEIDVCLKYIDENLHSINMKNPR
ncbi:hypothetical protein CYCD_20020 [Tenuifilaceae bacterium CYCD]|nr:hypothetical protein CYCD_20020 [Tenuifilaceae bacterium CYCD]